MLPKDHKIVLHFRFHIMLQQILICNNDYIISLTIHTIVDIK